MVFLEIYKLASRFYWFVANAPLAAAVRALLVASFAVVLRLQTW